MRSQFRHSFRSRSPVLTVVGAGVFIGLLMAGCSHAGTDSSSAASASAGSNPSESVHGTASDGRGPVFYLRQTGHEVTAADGTDARLQFYRAALKGCEGHVVKRLSPAEEQKLGTDHVQVWRDGRDRFAVRVDGYRLDNKTTISSGTAQCSFGLRTVSKLTVRLVDGGLTKTYTIDPDTGTGKVVESAHGPDAPIVAARPPDEQAMAAAGFQKLGTSTFAGQPCIEWKLPLDAGTACVWSGGLKWGYPASDVEKFPDFDGTPTMWLKSDGGGMGRATFTTQKFIVGSLPDHGKVFDSVKGIKDGS